MSTRLRVLPLIAAACASLICTLPAHAFGKDKSLQETEAYGALIGAGDYAGAATLAEDMLSAGARRKQKKGEIDPRALLAYARMGSALTWGGDHATAVLRFDEAESAVKDYETRVMGAGGVEAVAASLFGNSVKAYRPKQSDGILINTYKAMAFLALGRMDDARIEFNRADERTRRAVELFAKEIEKEQKAAAERDQAAQQAGQARSAAILTEHYPELANWQVYDDFVNPYTVYLHSLFFFASNQTPSDIENAVTSMERVAGMNPGSPMLASDLNLFNAVASGKSPRAQLPDYVWVICEDGMGPGVVGKEIDFAVQADNQAVPLKLVLPEMSFNEAGRGPCAVTQQGRLHPASEIASMDRIAQTEFKKRLPREITQAVVGLIVRGAVQNEMQKKGGYAGSLLGMAFQQQTAGTETRGWNGLPKTWYAVRVERPADGRLQVMDPRGGVISELEVPPGRMTIVRIRTPTAAGRVSTSIASFGVGS